MTWFDAPSGYGLAATIFVELGPVTHRDVDGLAEFGLAVPPGAPARQRRRLLRGAEDQVPAVDVGRDVGPAETLGNLPQLRHRHLVGRAEVDSTEKRGVRGHLGHCSHHLSADPCPEPVEGPDPSTSSRHRRRSDPFEPARRLPDEDGPGDGEADRIEGDERDVGAVAVSSVRNDCRKARFTSTPPKAPMAPASPISAPACRCDCGHRDRRRPRRCRSPCCDLAWKIAGIILYAEPLPMPLKTNSSTNPTRYSGSDCSCDATSTTQRTQGHRDEVARTSPAIRRTGRRARRRAAGSASRAAGR